MTVTAAVGCTCPRARAGRALARWLASAQPPARAFGTGRQLLPRCLGPAGGPPAAPPRLPPPPPLPPPCPLAAGHPRPRWPSLLLPRHSLVPTQGLLPRPLLPHRCLAPPPGLLPSPLLPRRFFAPLQRRCCRRRCCRAAFWRPRLGRWGSRRLRLRPRAALWARSWVPTPPLPRRCLGPAAGPPAALLPPSFSAPALAHARRRGRADCQGLPLPRIPGSCPSGLARCGCHLLLPRSVCLRARARATPGPRISLFCSWTS